MQETENRYPKESEKKIIETFCERKENKYPKKNEKKIIKTFCERKENRYPKENEKKSLKLSGRDDGILKCQLGILELSNSGDL